MEGISHSDQHSDSTVYLKKKKKSELIFVIFQPTNTITNLLFSCIREHHLLYLRQHRSPDKVISWLVNI